MTCIAGIVDKASGTVYIGGDSAGSNYSTIMTFETPKVFRVGDLLFGCCGSFRMLQLLQHVFVPNEHPEDMSVDEYMVFDFIENIRSLFGAGGFKRRINEEDYGGYFLVGYRGHLYSVASDFQIIEPADGLYATGSGGEIALGTLWALKNTGPEKRITRALEAAAHLTPFVRGPFTILAAQADERFPVPEARIARLKESGMMEEDTGGGMSVNFVLTDDEAESESEAVATRRKYSKLYRSQRRFL